MIYNVLDELKKDYTHAVIVDAWDTVVVRPVQDFKVGHPLIICAENNCYPDVRLAELYPKVRCLFGSAWLFDPEMEVISPHLTFLRLLVTENGGHLLYFGSSSQDYANATRTSKTRRRLVQEGKYTPTSYFVCWPRKSLLEWARRAA